MSEYHDTEAPLLPDDAEQKISDLLEALHASGELMMAGSVEVRDDAPEPALQGDGEPLQHAEPEMDTVAGDGCDAAYFPDGEADVFVDLDAEQLDNSTDLLQLDESDPYEELQEPDEPQRLLEPEPEPLLVGQAFSPDSEASRNAEEAQRHDDDALGQLFSAPGPAPVPVTVSHRPPDTLPSWLSPGALALLRSGAALWFSLTASSPDAAPVVASGDRMALESFKVDLAALRERLSAVEQSAAAGAEAVALLERMQAGLSRMEQQLITRGPSADSASAQVVEAVAVEVSPAAPVAPQQPVPALIDTNDSTAGAVAASPAMDEVSAENTLIKGWAVNLRSYYRQLDAERLVRRYHQAGIAAEIREIRKGVALWYRVRVKGFGSKQEANAFISGLADQQEREAAWPSYYEGYVKG
jgi:cell division protein FtsN